MKLLVYSTEPYMMISDPELYDEVPELCIRDLASQGQYPGLVVPLEPGLKLLISRQSISYSQLEKPWRVTGGSARASFSICNHVCT